MLALDEIKYSFQNYSLNDKGVHTKGENAQQWKEALVLFSL